MWEGGGPKLCAGVNESVPWVKPLWPVDQWAKAGHPSKGRGAKPSAGSTRNSDEGGAADYFDGVRAVARQGEVPTRSK